MYKKLRGWWKKKKLMIKFALIGIILGFLKIPFFIIFGESLPKSIHFIFSQIPDQFLCNVFSLESGEPCGFFVFFYGFIYNPIFYGIIGLVIGIVISKIKREWN